MSCELLSSGQWSKEQLGSDWLWDYIVFFDFLVHWFFCYYILMRMSSHPFLFFFPLFYFLFFFLIWCVSLLFLLTPLTYFCMHPLREGSKSSKTFSMALGCSLESRSVTVWCLPARPWLLIFFFSDYYYSFQLQVAYIGLPVSVPNRNSDQVWLLSSRACLVFLRAGSKSFQPNLSQQ